MSSSNIKSHKLLEQSLRLNIIIVAGFFASFAPILLFITPIMVLAYLMVK